jgi:RNA recognition motif-containing protein
MAKKLYVKNLAYSVTEDDLTRHFSSSGIVKYAKVLRDRETDRSRGSGFVEMATEEEARNAMFLLNGKELLGRVIFVEEARPMGEKPVRAFQPRPQYQPREYEQPQMTMHDAAWGAPEDRRQRRFEKRRPQSRWDD